MPTCKNCRKKITKFDKDICPYCGTKDPIDYSLEKTNDLTQVLDTYGSNEVNFIQRSRKVNSLLMMFLGFISADAFYLGFVKYGLIRLFINLVVYGGLFCIFYFLNVFSIAPITLSLVVSFLIIFFIYLILGLFSLRVRTKKDANGVLLK